MLIKNKDIAAKNHRHKVVTVVVRVAEEKNNLDSTVQKEHFSRGGMLTFGQKRMGQT
jgi:hypothetical protein